MAVAMLNVIEIPSMAWEGSVGIGEVIGLLATPQREMDGTLMR